ncbi:MAG: acetate kinase [Synechococcales cyanobacterium CRU_2_2]|nr:acetate kinase [Synechococcales cyanobacterium CRU_2_2]
MNILILNAGSSSQKSCLYNLQDTLPQNPPEPLWEAAIDWTHTEGVAELTVKTKAGLWQEAIALQHPSDLTQSSRAVTGKMLQTLWQGSTSVIQQPSEIDAVGHRVVHGGQRYQTTTRIDPSVKVEIQRLIPLAPAHNPANLEGIETVEQLLSQDVPQFAIFDTAFHSTIPEPAAIYPGPYAWVAQGIRRYGFHGTSHQYCAERAAQLLNQDLADLKLITCHLGNGCSLAAIHQGKSVDTTMGFTPMEGLMMGSRSGSVDPGILLYLMRQQGLGADELEQLLNKQSGLKGLSGLSNDLRTVRAAIAQGNTQAQLAYEVYIHRIRSGIGAMLASLGGLDALVFTAGVGENSAAVRSQVCAGFAFLGLALDAERNTAMAGSGDVAIAAPGSRVQVLVIHTQEDWQIAKACWAAL